MAALIAAVLVAATGISMWQVKLAVVAKKETADALAKSKRKRKWIARIPSIARCSSRRPAPTGSSRRKSCEPDSEREAFAHLARACEYDPLSTLAAEKAVAALNTWQHPLPATILAGHEGGVSERAVQPGRHAHRHRVRDKTARVWDAATGKTPRHARRA